jgi:hypothetical protein
MSPSKSLGTPSQWRLHAPRHFGFCVIGVVAVFFHLMGPHNPLAPKRPREKRRGTQRFGGRARFSYWQTRDSSSPTSGRNGITFVVNRVGP